MAMERPRPEVCIGCGKRFFDKDGLRQHRTRGMNGKEGCRVELRQNGEVERKRNQPGFKDDSSLGDMRKKRIRIENDQDDREEDEEVEVNPVPTQKPFDDVNLTSLIVFDEQDYMVLEL
jgi:hypothetical protein